jgi:hypothetical protein
MHRGRLLGRVPRPIILAGMCGPRSSLRLCQRDRDDLFDPTASTDPELRVSREFRLQMW